MPKKRPSSDSNLFDRREDYDDVATDADPCGRCGCERYFHDDGMGACDCGVCSMFREE